MSIPDNAIHPYMAISTPQTGFADLPLLHVFQHRDAAHCGLGNFYPECKSALTEALESGQPFDTGWYSTKQGGKTARISRYGQSVTVEVTVTSPHILKLVRDALIEINGGMRFTYAESALKSLYPGLNVRQTQGVLSALADLARQGKAIDTNEQPFITDIKTIGIICPEQAYGVIVETLLRLAEDLEAQMEAEIEQFKARIAAQLPEIVREAIAA